MINTIETLTGTSELWVNGSIAVVWACLIGYLLVLPILQLITFRIGKRR